MGIIDLILNETDEDSLSPYTKLAAGVGAAMGISHLKSKVPTARRAVGKFVLSGARSAEEKHTAMKQQHKSLKDAMKQHQDTINSPTASESDKLKARADYTDAREKRVGLVHAMRHNLKTKRATISDASRVMGPLASPKPQRPAPTPPPPGGKKGGGKGKGKGKGTP
jgi:hypothetical protein